MNNAPSCDVFLALAAVGWADGQLAPEEADGIVQAAQESGLSGQEVDKVRIAVSNPLDLDEVQLTALAPLERAFVYAVAVWLARLDGVVDPGERRTLYKLGHALGLPDGVRTQASVAAFEIASLPSGDRPGRFDLGALRTLLSDRLTRKG